MDVFEVLRHYDFETQFVVDLILHYKDFQLKYKWFIVVVVFRTQ